MKKILLALLILSSSIQTFCSDEESIVIDDARGFKQVKPVLDKAMNNINKEASFNTLQEIKDRFPVSFSEYINHVNENYRDNHTFLTKAIRDVSYNTLKIERLIDLGANVNQQFNNGDTPLSEAAIWNNDISIRLLLAAGADVNLQGEGGRTPLHEAAWSNSSRAIPLLIDAGANINQQDRYGNTPLHKAADHPTREGFKRLIDAGADINITNNKGYTARQTISYHRHAIFDQAVKDRKERLAAAQDGQLPEIKKLKVEDNSI